MNLESIQADLASALPYMSAEELREIDLLLEPPASRDIDERRALATDPWKYIDEILGWPLTPQQEEMIEEIENSDRVIVASANNIGKDFLVSAWALFRYDAVGSLPDPDRGLEEQGCQLLLPAPDAATAFSTIYSAILEHVNRATARGFLMPGTFSDKSVLARVRTRWFIEAFTPAKDAKGDVAHSASGRHHKNQAAIITEMQGVEERLIRATEGMCSGDGNKIVGLLNPTLAAGPAFERGRKGAYRELHLSAFDHPNVRGRCVQIPEAVSFAGVDARVKTECRDRGDYPGVIPDPEHDDFLYALPPEAAVERGPRQDGVIGHPDGVVRVYRPAGVFTPQVLGRWAKQGASTLFDDVTLKASIDRWRKRDQPAGIPDAVGFDVAREGDDDPCIVPRWGDNAEALLLAHFEARKEGEKALAALMERRAYLGEARILQKGDGNHVARQAYAIYPSSPWNIDEGGVGTSVLDTAHHVLSMPDAVGISFSASAPYPTPGEPWCENLRTSMYVRYSLLLARGLVDTPDDPLLREELLAHWLIRKERTVEKIDDKRGVIKERVESVLLSPKEEVKKKIGRSPDRADAVVLALVALTQRSATTVRRLRM